MKKSSTNRSTALLSVIYGWLCLGAALFLLLSLLSFHMAEMGRNCFGLCGWSIGYAFLWLLGLSAYLLPPALGWYGWHLLCHKPIKHLRTKGICFGLFVLACCFLLNLYAEKKGFLPQWLFHHLYTQKSPFDFPFRRVIVRCNLGGVPCYFLYKDLPLVSIRHLLSDLGTGLAFGMTAIVTFFLMTEINVRGLWPRLVTAYGKLMEKKASISALPPAPVVKERPTAPLSPEEKSPPSMRIHLGREPIAVPLKPARPVQPARPSNFQLPPPPLLQQPQKVDAPLLKKELKRQAEILEETLLSFGIEAKVGDIHAGPTIASFEVHPAVGVKVQKIKTLENDIALKLEAKSIRIIAPIPGKAAVGVEIPSPYPQEVSFKELLVQYRDGRKMLIPLLLGKTVAGESVISDLSKMPHCLIAGATGSGKSVCINAIIMSILMTATPDEIKLLMVDPKKVELSQYSKLPHMIAPVITEPQGAYAALNWLVKEMQLRYEMLKQLGLRNITAFNHRTIKPDVEASLSLPIPEKMYMIVAIIDEFADLMMASSSDLETPIARIAQMARAVGIHLILATQRPSREVITGLIKANFPTRLAFKVASKINSQIILDDTGAETLLGNGDMLFLPPGTSSLIRAQGVYVSDDEIQRVVRFIEEQAPPNYLIPSFDQPESTELCGLDDAKDALFEQAMQIVVETKTASTTYLQRKLKIGYARAASLMDELEARGVIGPQEGAKPRRILIKSRYETEAE